MELNRPIIYVADMMLDECGGGAELTSDAILQSSPYEIITYKSRQLNVDIVQKHLEKYWIIGNYFEISDRIKIILIKNVNYSVIEYDYKYCKHRNEDFCILLKGACNCIQQNENIMNKYLAGRSQLFWEQTNKLMNAI